MRHGSPLEDLPGPRPSSFPDPSSPTHQNSYSQGNRLCSVLRRDINGRAAPTRKPSAWETAIDLAWCTETDIFNSISDYRTIVSAIAIHVQLRLSSLLLWGSARNFPRPSHRQRERSGIPANPSFWDSGSLPWKATADPNWKNCN